MESVMKYTVKYGVDEVTRNPSTPPTIGDIRQDDNLQATLGYGDNINLLVNGVAQGDCTLVPDGAVVTVETAANQKA